jgi:hypothetical protein
LEGAKGVTVFVQDAAISAGTCSKTNQAGLTNVLTVIHVLYEAHGNAGLMNNHGITMQTLQLAL